MQEIYKDRKKFSKAVFEVASSDLVNMGISVVSYTLKDIRDEEVSASFLFILIVFLQGVGIANCYAVPRARVSYGLDVCPSVCPFITHWHCVKMMQTRITKSSRTDSLDSSISDNKFFHKFERVHIERGR